MRTVSSLGAVGLADFRERARRPVYLVVLLAAVGLGYLTVPAAGSHWVVLNAGSYRGLYTSAYVGTATALGAALWLCIGGFYVVRGGINRDASTGVGEILAATRLTRVAYLGGKLLGNALVLCSMAGVVAATALVIQLVRGESRAVDPVALLTPYIVITVPVLVLTAALAVWFETVPLLRAGLGNIVWFFVAMCGTIGAEGADAPLGGLGVGVVAERVRRDLEAQGLKPDGEFSVGFMGLDSPLRTFRFGGLDVSAALAGQRLVLVLVALGIGLLPVLWFRHAEPAPRAVRAAKTNSVELMPPFGLGELVVLARGASKWWWFGVPVVLPAGALVPGTVGLLAVLIWPVLVWSRLGTQQREHGVDAILDSYPAPGRRLAYEWLAGVVLTLFIGGTVALRAAVTLDAVTLLEYAGAAAGIPTAALVLGRVTRSERPFQVLFLLVWYFLLNAQ
jgi:hypothetical protein